ncbi:MAG: DUF1573 domain-containing protein [Bacteroidales bacterium]|nr:DUF1573 domain-containing protein [Bacteroidales bacterium]MDD6773804.1 DUF1573 domain-containing protein [Bacteroidales bacterium]MDO4214127.1 DUF1573 domain-containing protein [Bacteroidales bacterium]
MKSLLLILLTSLLSGGVTFDKTVHDFGRITHADGPQKCVFTLTNDSSEPLTIYAVVATCGCTEVKWTREDIEPGKSGIITVNYSNDEGAYTFDKRISVYTSAQSKPEILHIKGTVVSKKNDTK